MAMTQEAVSDHVNHLIAHGQRVYDCDGNKIGSVALHDIQMGWMTVDKGPFVHHTLYIPFSAISTIDKRELTLSQSKDDLLAAYSSPPARTATMIEGPEIAGKRALGHVTVTTVPSGYTGEPVQVDRSNLDEIKRQIAVGMRVFDVHGDKVGVLDAYNAAHDYLELSRSQFLPLDLFVPLALVDGVDLVACDVHLAVTKEHLSRVCVVRPDDSSSSSTIEGRENLRESGDQRSAIV